MGWLSGSTVMFILPPWPTVPCLTLEIDGSSLLMWQRKTLFNKKKRGLGTPNAIIFHPFYTKPPMRPSPSLAFPWDANLSLKGSAAPLLLRLKFHRRLWQQRFDFAILEVSGKKPTKDWLVVSPHPKNISQIGSFPQVGLKLKNIWNHRLEETTEKIPGKWTNDRSNTRDVVVLFFSEKLSMFSGMPIRRYQANSNWCSLKPVLDGMLH